MAVVEAGYALAKAEKQADRRGQQGDPGWEEHDSVVHADAFDRSCH